MNSTPVVNVRLLAIIFVSGFKAALFFLLFLLTSRLRAAPLWCGVGSAHMLKLLLGVQTPADPDFSFLLSPQDV